jgi:hypothetical protein
LTQPAEADPDASQRSEERAPMSLACPAIIGNNFPDLCAAVHHYCERGLRSDFNAEPLNAYANVAFLIAAVAAWYLQSAYPSGPTTKSIRAMTVLTALTGFGSFLFHTVATRWTEWADVIPILAFMLTYLWFVLTHFFQWSFWNKFFAVSGFFVLTFFLEAAVPSAILWGGALYLPTIVALVSVGAALPRASAMRKSMFLAVGVFLLSLTARTLDAPDGPVCALIPFGTHFLWHILNAVLLYLLMRTAILHTPPAPVALSRP